MAKQSSWPNISIYWFVRNRGIGILEITKHNAKPERLLAFIVRRMHVDLIKLQERGLITNTIAI